MGVPLRNFSKFSNEFQTPVASVLYFPVLNLEAVAERSLNSTLGTTCVHFFHSLPLPSVPPHRLLHLTFLLMPRSLK
jgi:hypothetical protein